VCDSKRNADDSKKKPPMGEDVSGGESAAAQPGDNDMLPAEELVPEEDEGGRDALPETQMLQREVELLGQQLEQMRDRYIRTVADLDNARKRARQAIAEARQQGVTSLLAELLPLMDNFERALESVNPSEDAAVETKAIYEGIELIYRQISELLERRGVRPIEALGQPFDPNRHEAVTQLPAKKGQAEGTIVAEIRKGYLYGDQVLRPSRVGVAMSSSEGKNE